MANYAEYVATETATNLWRNRVTTVAAVFTVMISLFLVGASLVLRQGAANAEVKWQEGVQVRVWMVPGASPNEVTAIKTQLTASPIVHGCVYRTQQQNYEEAKQLLTPTEISVLTPAQIPSSFNCIPNAPEDAEVVVHTFTGQPGVKEVSSPTQFLRSLQRWITALQWGFFSIALILLISSAVLILNTIRMAIFARRREVAVMKLVGATNWFIRVPFILEGLIQGLIGSVLAGGLLWAGEWLWRSATDPNQPAQIARQLLLTNGQLFWTEVVVIFLGVAIGSIGSAIAIRRFLDV